ncbi:MAG: ribonucleoside triphosphate reductase, partial [Desulfuromonadales bacterium]
GKIQSAPPKHFRTALGQAVNFFYTLQGEAAGAQAFANFDTLLAPFIRYDKLSYQEVKQSVQEFIFNMNVPTRVGFQTPFTNITLDMTPPKNMADEAVIIGGELMEETYGDFQVEMDLFNRAFCEVMMEGDASGRIFSFPIPTYNITAGFDWDSLRFQPIWEMTAKYGIPYFSNFINSDMDPEDARSMCCRLRLDNRELRRRGGGLFGSNPLTGSIGVVTLNLPRAAFQAEDRDAFFTRIGELMRLAHESLEIKRKQLERLTEEGLYPFSRFYLAGIRERSGHYWDNHFSTIGLLGMNEACLNLIGVGIDTPEGKNLAVKTLQFMRRQLEIFQEETGHLYNLEATPAEGTSFRLANRDRRKFPDIITSGTDEP